jgi:hypothetical protein
MTAEDQSFADVLNGFSLDSRRAHRRPVDAPAPEAVVDGGLAVPPPVGEPVEENAAIVRAYAWTGGRTRSDYRLEIETLVSTSARALDELASLPTEHQEVAQLCRQSKSVAEVSALLRLPLGVIKVLISDMARLGLVIVHHNAAAGETPELELLSRVLRGLTNLRS